MNVLGREVRHGSRACARSTGARSASTSSWCFRPTHSPRAPHTNLVTVSVAEDRHDQFLNRVAEAFPTVTAISVKDALDAVSSMLGKIVLAVRFANGLTLASGVLVLAGALATSLAARRYEAAVLKTYRRRQNAADRGIRPRVPHRRLGNGAVRRRSSARSPPGRSPLSFSRSISSFRSPSLR